MERRRAVKGALHIHIRASLCKSIRQFEMASVRRHRKRRCASETSSLSNVGRGPEPKQTLSEAHRPNPSRIVQCRRAVVVAQVGISALSQQPRNLINIVAPRRGKQELRQLKKRGLSCPAEVQGEDAQASMDLFRLFSTRDKKKVLAQIVTRNRSSLKFLPTPDAPAHGSAPKAPAISSPSTLPSLQP